MNKKTHCWKLYLDSTKPTDAAQQFKSERVDNSRMTLYIKKHRIPFDKITGVSFSYSPLPLVESIFRGFVMKDYPPQISQAKDINDSIVIVCLFKNEMVHSVRYDEISCYSQLVQVGSIYIPKIYITTPYPDAIKVTIDWLYALNK